jgi:hypothetical protein
MTVALSDEQLKEPWMTRALEYLLDAFEATEGDDLECGGLYHAAHGLMIYRERRFGQPSGGGVALPQSKGKDAKQDVKEDEAKEDKTEEVKGEGE